ncbi:MAG: hypothetical protein R3F17_15310, partial [Planctomycetota bacterium]
PGTQVHQYSIWLQQAGEALGVEPEPDGRFEAVGSEISTGLRVTAGPLGVELYRRDFGLDPAEEREIGTIDLRYELSYSRWRLLAADGTPLAKQGVWIQLDGAAGEGRGETDEQGWFDLVVPGGTVAVSLTPDGAGPVQVDPHAEGGEVRLP